MTVQRRRAPARPGADPAQTGRRSGTNTGPTQTGRPPGRPVKLIGGDLLSRAREGQVPSALRGLTALFGMGRGVSPSLKPPQLVKAARSPRTLKTAQRMRHRADITKNPSSPRPISTGLLRALPPFQIRPINLVISQGSYSLKGMGELISRSASRLDAFSGYPIRT